MSKHVKPRLFGCLMSKVPDSITSEIKRPYEPRNGLKSQIRAKVRPDFVRFVDCTKCYRIIEIYSDQYQEIVECKCGKISEECFFPDSMKNVTLFKEVN